MKGDAFRAAVEAEDPHGIVEALADDVVFRSPAVFKPYEGREVVGAIITQGAMRVFEDFRYTEQLEHGDTAALIFQARIGDRRLDGLDLLRFDADGKVRELMVMVRPLTGLNALAEAMGRRFETIRAHRPDGRRGWFLHTARPPGSLKTIRAHS